MRILVTGGAGFIGSHLVEYSLRQRDEVIVLDDLSTGRLHNLRFHLRHPALTVITGDCCDRETIKGLIQHADIIFHLAAIVGMKLVMSEPLRTLETNIGATQAVLAAAAAYNRPVLLISSSEVYGTSTRIPLREDQEISIGSPGSARYAYAYSKLIGESLAAAYSTARSLRAVTVRLFNTVGPRQSSKYGMVVPTLAMQALCHENMTVHGDGSQTRCFVHVSDVVAGLYAIATTSSAYGEVINIGASEETAILDLARMIRKAARSKSRITFVSHAQVYGHSFVDTARRIPDTGKAKYLVGFVPTISLRQIVDEVVQSCRETLASDSVQAAS